MDFNRSQHLKTALPDGPPRSSTGWTITREWEGYSWKLTSVSRGRPSEYLGIFFSGGRALEYILYDEDLVQSSPLFEGNKPVGCVCHGVDSRLYGRVRGEDGYGPQVSVRSRGLRRHLCRRSRVIDENLISGRTYHDTGHFVGPHFS